MTTRPERIAEMRDRLAEIDRAVASFRHALRASNDEQHQAFFTPVLNRIGAIVAAERDGVTVVLADTLSVARTAVRRLPLPDIDPVLDAPTPALKQLRGERGNLIEALDNALDAANALGLEHGLREIDDLRVERKAYAEKLIRLDERLRVVEDAVGDLRLAAAAGVRQEALVDTHCRAIAMTVSAARFETQVGSNPAIPADSDLAALARSVEAMHDVALDLRETVEGLGGFIDTNVRSAGQTVSRAAERSWRGMRTVVSWVRRARAGGGMAETPTATEAPEVPEVPTTPPGDLDLDLVKRMVVAGKPPNPLWCPWITSLDISFSSLKTLAPLAHLTELRILNIAGAKTDDLTPLSRLTRLSKLALSHTPVHDLSPLSGLTQLQELDLRKTNVRDLSPLSGFKVLRQLDIAQSQVSDISGLAGMKELRTLNLSETNIADYSPLSQLPALQTVFVQTSAQARLAKAAVAGRKQHVSVLKMGSVLTDIISYFIT